jgi:acetylornithine/succinyldiaminopimelate/putrescine aminotransferase
MRSSVCASVSVCVCVCGAGVEAIDTALKLAKALTAHPHACSVSGRTVAWSWAQNPAINTLSMTLVEWDDATTKLVPLIDG